MTTIFDIFSNFDLFSVGVALSALVLLGAIAYLNNTQNATARNFAAFAFATVIWNLTNFFQYQFSDPDSILIALRFNLFAAVWHAYFFFRLSYVFPKERYVIPWWNRYLLLPTVGLVSFLTLTPYVFSGIASLAPVGEVTRAQQGPAIVLFGVCAFGLLVAGLFALMRTRYKETDKAMRSTEMYMFVGMSATALLILLFNLVLPLSFDTVLFLPYAGVFMLPLVFQVAYNVYKRHLFNIKALAAQALTFVLGALTFTEVVTTHEASVLAFRSLLLVCIVGAGVALTRSVTREVEQREIIEKQEKELEESNVRLRELDKQKSEFLSFASHQLRTPLTAIKWGAGAILDKTYGAIPSNLQEPIQTIFDESSLMAVLVNDYLNVSRIEQGKMQYQFAPIDLAVVLKSVASQLAPGLKAKGLAFKSDFGKERTMVWGDSGKLTQIFGNIVDNAMKYTPKGSIQILLKKVPERSIARVEIRDTGIGMDDATRTKMFDKFSRGENAAEVNNGGSGLGLFIVKTFVEAHKGKIWAESEGLNKGTTFIVELPLLIQK